MIKAAFLRAVAWLAALIVTISHMVDLIVKVSEEPMPDDPLDGLDPTGHHTWIFAVKILWAILRDAGSQILAHPYLTAFQLVLIGYLITHGKELLADLRQAPAEARKLKGEILRRAEVWYDRFLDGVDRCRAVAAWVRTLPERLAERRRRVALRRSKAKQAARRTDASALRKRRKDPRDAGGRRRTAAPSVPDTGAAEAPAPAPEQDVAPPDPPSPASEPPAA